MKPTIILISANGPGAGKTTFAKVLVENLPHSLVMSFASPLKTICRETFGWDGDKDEKGRLLLQEIGCAARHYNPLIWAEKARQRVDMLLGHDYIVFDDTRFANEAWVFIEAGYDVIQFHIHREGVEAEHESERYIPDHYIPVYSGDYEEFVEAAKQHAKRIRK